MPLILSGGLSAGNVAEAIGRTHPYAVDSASGTESAPGHKDPAKLRAFFRRVAGSRLARATGSASRRELGHRGREHVEHRFGPYGGQFVPETLMPALAELEQAWLQARDDAAYRAELDGLLRDFGGRPTPLYRAERLSERAGRRVYLKREDLNHTGSHKLNNALGQALLASGWASGGSSLRPAPASTASRPRRCARCSGSNASSTWASRTRAASTPTSSAWSCSARACSRSTRARGR